MRYVLIILLFIGCLWAAKYHSTNYAQQPAKAYIGGMDAISDDGIVAEHQYSATKNLRFGSILNIEETKVDSAMIDNPQLVGLDSMTLDSLLKAGVAKEIMKYDTVNTKETVLIVSKATQDGSPEEKASYWVYDTSGVQIESGEVTIKDYDTVPVLTFKKGSTSTGETLFTGETGQQVLTFDPSSVPSDFDLDTNGDLDFFQQKAKEIASGKTSERTGFWH